MEKYIHIICLVFIFRDVFSQSNGGCFTPHNLNGVCINIKRCPGLLSLVENQRQNNTVLTFLRNSFCGYEGKDPKVCCPLENNNPINGPPDNIISSHKLPHQNACGRTNTSHIRIVGGHPAELGDWPWMVALGYRGMYDITSNYQWLCGGALISNEYIITAAHCTVGLGNRVLAVAHLGDLNLDPNIPDEAEPIDVPISRIITHERFNNRENTNDIALLKLRTPVRFNKFIQPICLPVIPKVRNNKLVKMEPFVAGWGATSFRGPSSTALMEVQIPVLDNADCKRLYGKKKNVIDDGVLCAGNLKGGQDSCQGDSGGPLMWPLGTQYYLVGVVSYGFKCAEPGFPGVYARVSSFVDWISINMNNS